MAVEEGAGHTKNAVFSDETGSVIQARTVLGGVHLGGMRAHRLPTPRLLPADVRGFTGRDAELARLDHLLGVLDGAVHAVVISAVAGSAGVGKTALAVHWAHRAASSFPDGQLYMNLRGYGPGPVVTPALALEEFLRALDVPGEKIPVGTDARAGMFRSLLAGRRVLVILDNAATADQVRPLLPGTSGCMVLVTSRSRLSGLVAETGARRITLGVLGPVEAAELIGRFADPAQVGNDPEAIATLASLCAYLPLALRVAAERIDTRPSLTVATLAKQLRAEHGRLDALTVPDDETTSVRVVFSWSYRALPSKAARLFRLLGLHAGPEVSVPAAAALLGTSVAESSRLLDTLSGAHLIEESGADRYRFHDLLRSYAIECAGLDEPEPERNQAVRRLLGWYLHTANAALRLFYPQHPEIPIGPVPQDVPAPGFADRDQATAWCDRENANLLAAIRQAVDNDVHDVAWKLAQTCDAYWWRDYRRGELLTAHRLGLVAARRSQDRLGQLWTLLSLGEACCEFGEFNRAVPPLRYALRLARIANDKLREGWALGDLGNAYVGLNRTDEAVQAFKQSLAIYQEVDHPRSKAVALVQLSIALRSNRPEEALHYAEQSLEVYRTIGHSEFYVQQQIARCHLVLGDIREGIRHLQQAIEAGRKFGERHALALALEDLGAAHHGVGEAEQALVFWQESLTILEELESPHANMVRSRIAALSGPTRANA